MDKIPPPPQQVAVLGSEGKLSLPWNLWLTEFIKTLQNVGDGLDALGLYGSGSGGGVASSGGGPAVDLSLYPSSEGLSNLGARADHLHQMALQAEWAGTSLGIVQAINALAPFIDLTREPNLVGSLLTDLWARYACNEVSGTRYLTYGSGPNLAEVGGTVTSTTGEFGLAVDSDKTNTQYLKGTMGAKSFNSGLTIGCWVNLKSSPPASPGGIMALKNSAGSDWIFLARHFNGNGVQFGFRSPGGVSTSAAIPVLSGTGVWIPVMAWWDSGTNTAEMQVDNGPIYNRDFGVASTSVNITGWSFDELYLVGGNGIVHGSVDELTVWDRTLTAAERSLWFTSSRANVEVNAAALELFGG